MYSCDILFEDFYCLIAQYLLEKRLIDRMEFDERHLVVHEASSDLEFEFVLRVHRFEKGGEK